MIPKLYPKIGHDHFRNLKFDMKEGGIMLKIDKNVQLVPNPDSANISTPNQRCFNVVDQR